MMVACASVCNSGPEPSAPEAGLSSLDVLVPQYQHAQEADGADLLSDVRELFKVLERPRELVQNAQFQQQALQAALQHAEQSLLQSRMVLTQLAGKMQRAPAALVPSAPSAPVVREAEAALEPKRGAADAGEQKAPTHTEAPPSPALSPEFTLAQHQQRRAKTAQTLLSQMGASEELPMLSKGYWPFLQVACRRVVHSTAFEFLILAVIIGNSVVIGVESQLGLNDEELAWGATAENFFLAVYSIEILMRLVAGRFRITCDGWFFFDVLLVVSSYLERIIELISGESAEQLMLLRLLRLIRLVRTFRMVRQVRPLWRLVHGLLTSLDTVLSTFLLLALVLYVFGVLGLEIIATNSHFKDDPVTSAILQRNFSSLGVAMITLAQFVTMDSIAAIYLPLVRIQPWLMLYFTMLIFIVSISVMNLVTAALVEGTLENARMLRQEEERMRSVSTQQMLPEILELFDLADADGSGELAIEEMRQFEESGHVPEQILDRASVSSMTELFNVLDVDQSGVVTREEFAEGLLDIFLRDVSVSSLQQMKLLRGVRDSLSRLEEDLGGLKRQAAIL